MAELENLRDQALPFRLATSETRGSVARQLERAQ